MDKGARIYITGIVQGVGFRPFIYNLAKKHRLAGWCLNDSGGVTIEVAGHDPGTGARAIERFIEEIKSSPPPLSRIETLTTSPLPPVFYNDFVIKESEAGEGKTTLISPDVTTCKECLAELLDPNDRRYLYPFINCTNCGPRYSIVRGIPYDRPSTTMAPFTMCPECAAEYQDPGDRRFHAEPNGCEKCGPRVWLVKGATGTAAAPAPGGAINSGAVLGAQKELKNGAIVAVKGLGGFHLACDARNARAMERLRKLKRGSNKPFALMAPDIDTVKTFCYVSKEDERLLAGLVRPIVIMERQDADIIPGAVAPNNNTLGVMLPYTPLHKLLFTNLTFDPNKDREGSDPDRETETIKVGSPFTALVMTSGNVADEPIVTSNEEAMTRLGSIADCFLFHDRDIYMRVDDSIVRSGASGTRTLRRARGFTPVAIELGGAGEPTAPEVLACGGELKNTLCLAKTGKAVMSQHIGDMENLETLEFFKETLRNLTTTFRVEPSVVTCDMHPDYLSSVFAREYAEENGLPLVTVQHHHAHIASVMAEHNAELDSELKIDGEVIGIAFDGTGFGTDGRVWGGEVLTVRFDGFERAAHLAYVPMPGGDRAVKEPWRMAVAYLYNAFGRDFFNECDWLLTRLEPKKVETVLTMIDKGLNSPLTSSAGRLFDAVSSILGVRDVVTFEGEAAIELEMKAVEFPSVELPSVERETSPGSFPFEVVRSDAASGGGNAASGGGRSGGGRGGGGRGGSGGEPAIIDTRPLIKALVEDVRMGVPVGRISLKFHHTIKDIILRAARDVRERTGLKTVALSGGVFQNTLLLGLTVMALEGAGFRVMTNERVPTNDGGIALGQAAVALRRESL